MKGRVSSGVVLVGIAWVAGCYEISPRLPPGYRNSPPPAAAWPATAVYDSDPLAPGNRWFQRGYSPRGPGGTLGRVAASVPLPLLEELAPVDCAELAALLDAAEAESPHDGAPGRAHHWVTRAVFHSDALQLVLVVARRSSSSSSCKPLLDRLIRASTCGDAVGESNDLPQAVVPPPLRQGRWLEWPGLLSSEFLPSTRDLRWGRLLSEESQGSHRWILLRLRVGLAADRSPRLLPVASECWDVSDVEGGGASVVCWRFDRAEWIQGRDPWVPLVLDDTEEEVLEGLAATHDGSLGKLVPSSFRASGTPPPADALLPIEYRPILEKSWRDVQRRAVQVVLDKVLASR